MFSKKKVIDMLFISLLLSLVIIISFFNLISEEQSNENFAGTVLYIIVFASAAVIAYVLGERTVSFFSFGYFVIISLCFCFGFIMELFDLDFGMLSLACSLLISPFYGFMYITDHWVAVSFIAALVLCALSAVISFFPRKDHSLE
ncbi:MAG: hypothetical protein IJZ89_01665 [Clostridia bacterium]|nr:hypothetical protein [Clostridia bacterium]